MCVFLCSFNYEERGSQTLEIASAETLEGNLLAHPRDRRKVSVSGAERVGVGDWMEVKEVGRNPIV